MKSRIATALAAGLAAVALIAAVSAIVRWPSAAVQEFGFEPSPLATPDTVGPVTAANSFGPIKIQETDPKSVSERVEVAPERLAIPTLGVDMTVTALGLAPDGTMALNDRADTAAWYQHGGAPGDREAAALIAAHVASDVDGVGSFSKLRDAKKGDVVTVTMSDGTEQPFTVVRLQEISKTTVGYDAMTAESPGMLILVACRGEFDPTSRHVDDNVIVWASSLLP